MWFDKVDLRNLLAILEEKYPRLMKEEEIKEKFKETSIRQEDLYRYLHFCREHELITAGKKKAGKYVGLYPARITHQGIAYIHDLR